MKIKDAGGGRRRSMQGSRLSIEVYSTKRSCTHKKEKKKG